MLTRIATIFRRLRRALSRSEWLGYLLKLPPSADTTGKSGLVMVQIDGLSHRELKRAIKGGEMPFLKQLIKRENYQLHRLYSGIPSTTPAAQGELFYGIKTAVPSFNYKPHNSEELVRMFEPGAAEKVEASLSAMQTTPLLANGSSYANNFTGGAAEAHFCPSALGWGAALRGTRPLVLLVCSHLYSFIRTLALMLLETLLAIIDCTRGLVSGRDLWAELKFIPSRVLIVILLRELTTIGVKIDIARGLPIIHVNFLGYDEQAHRRNPKSLFAHWTLRGIDDAIARVWRATLHSSRRSYDLWIYSDHGQQQVAPYAMTYGRDFAEAATNIFNRILGCSVDCKTTGGQGIQLERIRMFGGRRTQRLFGEMLANIGNGNHTQKTVAEENRPQLSIATLGPVAHFYFNQTLAPHQLSALAQALCKEAHVPVVLYCNPAGQVRVCRRRSEYNLNENPSALFGADYPYPEMACEDIQRLCQHPDAGVLIASGQLPSQPENTDYRALSFAVENGAHGGWSDQQTDAFALLPEDIYLSKTAPEGSRLMDIRVAALDFIHPQRGPIKSRKDSHKQQNVSHSRGGSVNQQQKKLRIMTYNVHSCIGMDGKLAPERIARVIARYNPDIVALQELDVNRYRTQKIDQADVIAQYLGMQMHFHGPIKIERERFGNAILSALPMQLIKAGNLPGSSYKPNTQPRGALWVAIEIFGHEIQLINTHLSLRSQERRKQAQSLLSDTWLRHPNCREPTILCGDFNARPGTPEWHNLNQRLPDAQVTLENHVPKKTFFSRLPTTRIDHIFMDRTLQPQAIFTPNNSLARVASDHLPLVMDISLTPADNP